MTNPFFDRLRTPFASARMHPSYTPDAIPHLVVDAATDEDALREKARTLYRLIDLVVRDASFAPLGGAQREAAARLLFTSAWFASRQCTRRGHSTPSNGFRFSVFGLTPEQVAVARGARLAPRVKTLLQQIAGRQAALETLSDEELHTLLDDPDADLLAAYIARLALNETPIAAAVRAIAKHEAESWRWYEALVAGWATWYGTVPDAREQEQRQQRFRAESLRGLSLLAGKKRWLVDETDMFVGDMVAEVREHVVKAPLTWLVAAPALFSIALPAMFTWFATDGGSVAAATIFPQAFRAFLCAYAVLPLVIVGSLLDRHPKSSFVTGAAVLAAVALIPVTLHTTPAIAATVNAAPLAIAVVALAAQVWPRRSWRALLAMFTYDPPTRITFLAAGLVLLLAQGARSHAYPELFPRSVQGMNALHVRRDSVVAHFVRSARRSDERDAGFAHGPARYLVDPVVASSYDASLVTLHRHFSGRNDTLVAAITATEPPSSIPISQYSSYARTLVGGSDTTTADSIVLRREDGVVTRAIAVLDSAEASDSTTAASATPARRLTRAEAALQESERARIARSRRNLERLMSRGADSAYAHSKLLVQRMWAAEFNAVRIRIGIGFAIGTVILAVLAVRLDDERRRAIARAATLFLLLLFLPLTRRVNASSIDPDEPFSSFALAPWNGVEAAHDLGSTGHGSPDHLPPVPLKPTPIDTTRTPTVIPDTPPPVAKAETVFVLRDSTIDRRLQPIRDALSTIDGKADRIATDAGRLRP